MNISWPPVIGASNVPWWARLRDIVLTLAAWLLLAYLMMPMLRALWIDMQVVLGLSPPGAVPAMERLWQDLRPFLRLVALLTLFMLAYAAVRNLALRRSLRDAEGSPSLDRTTHAQYSGLTPEEAGQLHEARVAVVEFDAAFRIAVIDTSGAGHAQAPRPE